MFRMKSWLCLFIFTLAAAAAMAQEAPPAAPEAPPANDATPKSDTPPPVDRVIARVGDFNITESEFKKDLMLRWNMQGKAARATAPPDSFQAKVLREIVDARILRILAKNAGITATEEEVQAAFDEGRRSMPSDKEFNDYLKAMDISAQKLMDEVRDRIVVDKFRDKETADVTVSDEEVSNMYETLKKNNQTTRATETYDVGQILMMTRGPADADWEAARAKLEEAIHRVIGGEAFEAVAKDVSEDPMSAKNGGLYREAEPDKMGPEAAEQIKKLPIGQLSEPFRSNIGWHVVKVYAKYPAGEMTLEQIAPVIRENILDTKRNRKLAEMIQDARNIIRVEIMPQETQL